MTIRLSTNIAKREFFDKLAKISGQNIQQCFQCGTCTGACPMLDKMDTNPRKIMRMAQAGMYEKLENVNTCWVCASCHSCNVMCPRGVDLPKIMEALRQMRLRKNQNMIEPSRLPVETIKECPQIAMVAGFRKLTS
ncbi:MAG: 4Fe-4S dicluster domain-containing protein [Deltaproteobacteria bacterium]|nr:4Fe-4S dicluster domain-containing protein [Deltaproteobacteria bacterium]